MRRSLAAFSTVIGLVFSSTANAGLMDIFKKDLDKVPETAEMRAQEQAALALVASAQEYESQGKTGKAFDTYRSVVKKFPLTTSAAMGQYKVGAIQKSKGEWVKAFDSYQDFVDNYKQSSAFDAAIASQFEIAKASQTGEHKETFIGISRKVQRSEVLKMYQSIIDNAPYSEYAPQAQYALGEVLEKDGKSNEAIAAYKKVVADHPDSKLAADAQYRVGVLGSKAIEKGSRNIENVERSREAFEDILLGFEDDARREEAQSRVVEFTELEAQKALDIGKFYEKQKKYNSAALYYRRVAGSSSTTASAEATDRLAKIQPKVTAQATAAPDPAPLRTEPVEAASDAASGIRSKVSRPRIGSRLFGRKKREEAQAEADAAAAMAAIDRAASPPPVETAAPQPIASTPPKPTTNTSSDRVATTTPSATKLKKRKNYHGPPPPELAIAKKPNRMRLGNGLANLPFGFKKDDVEKGLKKLDEDDVEKGLKKLRSKLGKKDEEEVKDEIEDLVIPPSSDDDDGGEALKIPDEDELKLPDPDE